MTTQLFMGAARIGAKMAELHLLAKSKVKKNDKISGRLDLS